MSYAVVVCGLHLAHLIGDGEQMDFSSINMATLHFGVGASLCSIV